ncbi:MAG: class I SAM-dependent methyltransferase [Acidobacteria bacterium]|nr:MAG: class I SAM-dependent methyltransferase [Acidobacteriota bacterium]
MSSMMESTLTAEQHALLAKVLVAQTESLGRVETPVVEDLLNRHRPKRVLDIGCGEASFLLRLARRMQATEFVGIDHSRRAVDDAVERVRREGLSNVRLEVGFFDPSFAEATYDAVMTRYTLQHSSQPQAFVDAAFARLRPGGGFVALESLDALTDSHEADPVWDRFRTALTAVHRHVGSNQDIGKSLGALLRNAGFREIQVRVVLCSPSTVGWEPFSAVVRASAALASTFFPELFDVALRDDLDAWLDDRALLQRKDPYLCSAIANGTRP